MIHRLISLMCLAAMLTPSGNGQASDNPAHEYPKKMVNRLKKLAGSGATDCGIVGIWQPADAANNCALSAFRARKPFFVRHAFQGIDTLQVSGYAGDQKGDVYSVSFWSDLDADPDDGHLSVERCSRPVNLRIAHAGWLTCFLRDP